MNSIFVLVLDYLQDRAKGSTLYGFRGGPAGIMKGKYIELNSEYVYPYRNQVRILTVSLFTCIKVLPTVTYRKEQLVCNIDHKSGMWICVCVCILVSFANIVHLVSYALGKLGDICRCILIR